ncbi:MAG: MFS transporter, partial [Nitrospinaceae bacterium]|nr:MFS transporter [Nitrospinaceae bacterium]
MTDRPDRLAIASWSLYDFANTIFSMNVISLYFALWVTVDHGGQDIFYSAALSGSMFAVAISVPLFGAISDQTGRRRGPLTLLTIISVIATALIGQASQLWAGICLFVIANYCYQSALVFYNGMLPAVSRHSNVGMVSGYGVALGYMGSIAGLLLVKPFVETGGRPAAFLPTALMFLIFALPCFFFVKDPDPKPFRIDTGKAFRTLKNTLVNAAQYHVLLKFIGIHFLILDVVNTVIAFIAVYANKVIGFTDSQITTFLILSTTFAMLGSWLIGQQVKYKGTVPSYWTVLCLWLAALTLIVVSPGESLFWVVGPLAGMGMGGVWVVSRTIVVELSPPEKVGEFFGIYGLAGKMASIVGPLIWGSVVWLFQDAQTLKYRAAIFSLLLITIITLILFGRLQKHIPA